MKLSSVCCKEESCSSKGRHVKMHVGHSLTSYSEGSSEDHGKQSGDDDDQVRPRQTEFCKVLRCQTVQTLVHRRTQFEDDALRDVQPVQFIVKDVRQTPIRLPSSGNDSAAVFRMLCSFSVIVLGAFVSNALP